MAMVRGNFSSLLAPGLNKVIFEQYDEASLVHPKIFKMETSSRKYEDDQQISGFGLVPEKAEGQAVSYDEAVEAWSKRYTHTSYGLGFRVTKEMYADDLYGIMNKMGRCLGRSARATIETITADILNDGFATVGPDGQYIFDTDHSLKGSTDTCANHPSTDADLSVASLEAAVTAFRGWKDEQGLKMSMTPKILVVSASDEFTATKILGSTNQPFVADNQINVLKSRGLQLVVWDYIDDSDSWFLLASPSDHEMKMFTRQAPVMDSSDDFDTGDAKYKIYFRFSAGVSDWRGLYGAQGA